jgi:hypothetical protein
VGKIRPSTVERFEGFEDRSGGMVRRKDREERGRGRTVNVREGTWWW